MKAGRIFAGYAVCSVLCISCFLLTVFSDIGSAACSNSLSLCVTTVIPSLFPYMVVSSMLISTGSAQKLSKIIPLNKIYNLPSCASIAIILGYICGFPLGAKTAVDLYKNGYLTKTQTEVLISVANNTGPSFVVSVIGAAFWKSTTFGWWLYFIQIVSSIIAGTIINRVIFKIQWKSCTNDNISLDSCSVGYSFFAGVKDAISASVNVCGFVMIFSVIGAYFSTLIEPISYDLSVLISVILEFTEGSAASSTLARYGNIKLGSFLCGFTLGFSGLSVFSQTASFSTTEGINLSRLVLVKLLQGLICGAVAIPLGIQYGLGNSTTAYLPLTVPDGLYIYIFYAVSALFFTKILIKAHKM